MSRIGKKPIVVESAAKYELAGDTISVEGPKGKLQYRMPGGIMIEKQDDTRVPT